MRLSPIIKRLLGRFISRFFTKTLASATFSAAAAVFSFAFLPAAHAADEEVKIPRIPSWNEEKGVYVLADDKECVYEVDGKKFEWLKPENVLGGGKIDLKNIDTTLDWETGLYWETGSILSDEDKDKKTHLYIRLDDVNRHVSAVDPGSEIPHITIDYQKYFGKSGGAESGAYSWRAFKPYSSVDDNSSSTRTKGKDQLAGDKGLKVDAVKNCESGAEEFYYLGDRIKNQLKNAIPSAGSVLYGLTSGSLYSAYKDKDFNQLTNGNGKSIENASSTAKGGAALFLTAGTTLKGDIEASFINNRLQSNSNGVDIEADLHGGAVYVSNGAKIDGTIKSDFIGNYLELKKKGFGGALYNLGEIGAIEGNFIGNFIQGEYTNTANGGAISNGSETLINPQIVKDKNLAVPDSVGNIDDIKSFNEKAKIGSIKGYFIGNYVTTLYVAYDNEKYDEKEAARNTADTIGGAIVNYGVIGSVEGVFVGNYAESPRTANSGVIRNYQKDSRAIIGDEDFEKNENGETIAKAKPVINGIFLANYAKGGVGDATGGVMRNNGIINGKIMGLYVGNYAVTKGEELTSKGPEVGTYNYIRENESKDSVTGETKVAATRERAGMAFGGVFYNDLKTDMGSKEGRPIVGDIEATFIDNYVASTWGEAYGGAIVNRDSRIATINSTFVGNHAKSEQFMARGGAIYNDQSGYFKEIVDPDTGEVISYHGEIDNLGDQGAYEKHQEYTSYIAENYAEGKSAQGGAIFIANESTIKNIYAVFEGNYSRSQFGAAEDTEYYLNLRPDELDESKLTKTDGVYVPRFKPEEMTADGKLRPTAQGGAIYVARDATTDKIFAIFNDNHATTTGVGTLSVDENGEYGHKDGAQSANEREIAQGGAIYVSRGGRVLDVVADFTGNYAENIGNNNDANLKGVESVAQGGAIYVAEEGSIESIGGSFAGNAALGHSENSTTELAEGGAIYVSAGGSIQKIGEVDETEYNSLFSGNKAEIIGSSASGSQLVSQDARGGAIYVSSSINDKGDPVKVGSITDVKADFWNNEVVMKAEANQTQLETRLAQGGAIYVSYGASIDDIDNVEIGFVGNKITVSGGSTGAQTETLAQGGAIYVAKDGHTANLSTNFIGNSVESTSQGNKTEAVGGGAIFVQEGGYIGNIGRAADPSGSTAADPIMFYQNSITANGNDAGTLTEQRARGGAIYISESPTDKTNEEGEIVKTNEGYSVRDITGSFIKNTITLAWNGADQNDDTLKRIARGGALYVADKGKVESISQAAFEVEDKDGKLSFTQVNSNDPENEKIHSGFSNNSITVSGGNANNKAELIAQGGAVYVSREGKIDSIDADFRGNSITTDDLKNEKDEITVFGATGNRSERLGGGAIYIDGDAKIGNIGEDLKQGGGEVTIADNSLTAGGKGANLTEQVVRGGAIFVGAVETRKPDGTIEVSDAGRIENIYADIQGNSIVMNADGTAKALQVRHARGGALFVSDGGEIKSIEQGDSKDEVGNLIDGFNGNSITVSGGNAVNSTELIAQGGAVYVSEEGKIDSIVAGFSGNSIDTMGATGNKKEYLGGGAIYIDGEAKIGNIGDSEHRVAITGNSLTAGGLGANLEEQRVRGGAIFVGAVETLMPDGSIVVAGAGEIGHIYADIHGNHIEMDASDGAKHLTNRYARGGALFMADEGKILTINPGNEAKGFYENTITVTGGAENAEAKLYAGGGAIYISRSGGADGIFAGFADNKVNTTGALGNTEEYVRGGAVFLDAGGTIGSIGSSEIEDGGGVEIKGNALYAGGNGENLKVQMVQGGALYLSANNDDSGVAAAAADNKKKDTVGGIYADVTGNKIEASLGQDVSADVTREIQGGAIYLGNNGTISKIVAKEKGFVENGIEVTGPVGDASRENVYGGAIYVANGGQIASIEANFIGNYAKNTGEEGDNKNVKGGAIYLGEGGTIKSIGTSDNIYKGNYVEGSGEVRGGALFVSYGMVEDIKGDFLENEAKGREATLTYGGAVRFDGATIYVLESNFRRNISSGHGGGLSLTETGKIYEVRGSFLGNEAILKGGAVENLGDIGMRGHVLLTDGKLLEGGKMKDDYSNVSGYGEGALELERDATDRWNPSGNKQRRWEYDGSFTGGFVNSNFLYNTIHNDDRGYGAAIYTDKDLFITVNHYQETIMSGNHVWYKDENGVEKIVRSAMYVDNSNYFPGKDESQTLVIYVVAKDNGILRIDDNIRSYDQPKIDPDGNPVDNEGFTLRLRGYTTNIDDDPHRQQGADTGLIILNNRVENSYSIMDDVTLYVGYRLHTYQDEDYIDEYKDQSGELADKHIKESATLNYEDLGLVSGGRGYVYLVGDEFDKDGNIKDIIREDAAGNPEKSTYLNTAGKATAKNDREEIVEIYRADHQSDVFRDSHLSVRSGTVALTESTYANKIRSNSQYGSGTEMMKEAEVYTEYLFGSLIAYGVDYNYADYGTSDERVQKFYKKEGDAWKDAEYTDEHGEHSYREGDKSKALFADFEFGVGFDRKDLYVFEPTGKYYYKDMNGNYTEKSSWIEVVDGEEHQHQYEETDTPVKRQMAKSDVLSVFAVWDDKEGDIKWDQSSKGRVTLNGITVKAPMDGWEFTKKSVNGAQPDEILDESGKDELLENGVHHFNRDIYLQLINYTLLEETPEGRKEVTDAEKLERFHEMFKEEDKDNLESGYHLLRLSDHFNLVQDATAFMRGSQVLADEIELATTLTEDDSVRIVNWRDHLAEWAEHEGSLTDLQYDEAMGNKDTGKNQELSEETEHLYTGRKHFYLDQTVYYLNRNINLMANPVDGDATTGAAMWGQFLTIEGKAIWSLLDLQHKNMLSWIINDQEVRLQSFSLTGVQNDHMQNEGHLILDTMRICDGKDFSVTDRPTGLVVNNAGTGNGTVNKNQMTVTGLMDINFTITTESEKKQVNKLLDGRELPYYETKDHGTLIFDNSTQVTTGAAGSAEGESQLLGASVVHIKGVVEHQNIFHYGEDNLKLASNDVTYKEEGEEAQTLPTYSIETGNVNEEVDVRMDRETFTTNTYLETTVRNKEHLAARGYYYEMTDEFRAFVDNSLTMNGGAFNLGHMYKHRLVLRDFAVNGGGVFVDHSVVNLREEVMGGIDTTSSATYKGDEEAAAGKSVSGTGNGLIWLERFKIEGSSDKLIVHVKFVDDGVGNAVKDGMGIADGPNSKGNMRIMRDGEGIYNWEVTYNDEEAVNVREHSDVGIRGMYTFRRKGFTPEAQVGPVTDMTGSFVSMMQVYDYAFQHADMFADSMADAMRENLYERSYSAVTPVKGDKNAVPSAPALRPCVDKNGLKRGMWLNTYASTEEMPLHNGPKVHMNMYGGFIGGDSSVIEHRNGWDSVWSLYGGYMGSTQRYEGVRIRQNGAAIGGTGTFYKGDFYTALTASVGVSQATATGAGGSEDYDMLMGGIASRTGYNFRLDGGRYVLQPNVQLSYTMFNTFDYTNAYGSHVEGKPTGVFQVHPFVKLIMKTDCTWKPYGTVGFVYNAFGKTRYTINGTNLPSVSVDPYAEYSVGVQRSWKEGYTLYIQATGRSGGRNGGELSSGLRWTW